MSDVKTESAASCYIEKLEEYIAFLTTVGNKNAVFLASHGVGDSTFDIAKGAKLREELYNL